MSAHHQEYVFATKVHQLWGYMLVLFGILRISTYAFLWLRPPASVLPSRPPTEALASFFCAAGGLVFMLSTEQVVFSAMANGLDDVMTINNLALAGVGILFAWQATLTGIKGQSLCLRCYTVLSDANRLGFNENVSILILNLTTSTSSVVI
jgi:hypothetical protein